MNENVNKYYMIVDECITQIKHEGESEYHSTVYTYYLAGRFCDYHRTLNKNEGKIYKSFEEAEKGLEDLNQSVEYELAYVQRSQKLKRKLAKIFPFYFPFYSTDWVSTINNEPRNFEPYKCKHNLIIREYVETYHDVRCETC